MIIGTYLAYLSLVVFSFSLNKHYKEVMKKDLTKVIKNTTKGLGTVFLIGSLVVLIDDLGVSLGITYWVGILAPLTILIAMIFTYKPKQIMIYSVILLFFTLLGSVL